MKWVYFSLVEVKMDNHVLYVAVSHRYAGTIEIQFCSLGTNEID